MSKGNHPTLHAHLPQLPWREIPLMDMAAAGIVPQTTQVRTGEEALHRITGAQAPSGIPVVFTAPVVERPKKRGATWRGGPPRLDGPPRTRTAVHRRCGGIEPS